MSMVKLNVPYLVGDAIRNPGEEVDMTDEGRVAFAVGMGHAEAAAPPEGGALSSKHALLGDKPNVGDKPHVEPIETSSKKGK